MTGTVTTALVTAGLYFAAKEADMGIRDYIAECETQISAIGKNRKFWGEDIASLERNGVRPAPETVEWVKVHLDGLDASRKWLEDHITEIKERQDREGRNSE